MRERLKWDVREGMSGAEGFVPKHAITVTWKNVSFTGGIDNSLYTTNTFQMVLATDEANTYAMFNYPRVEWTSHTEAGGDTVHGDGGISAFVSFHIRTYLSIENCRNELLKWRFNYSRWLFS